MEAPQSAGVEGGDDGREGDGADGADGADAQTRSGWGGVSVPVQVQTLAPGRSQGQRPGRGRVLSLGKLPGYELQVTGDNRS